VATKIRTGLLVGRPPLGKASYEYIIIPKEEKDVDALVTTLPPSILKQMFVVNSTGVAGFLPGFYVVPYRRYDVPSVSGGWLHKAVIVEDGGEFKPVIVDINDPVNSLSKIDEVLYDEFTNPPEIGAKFLRQLARTTGAGTGAPKRFLATQVAVVVKDENRNLHQPVVVSLAECYLFLQENPSFIKGVAILSSYQLPIIIGSAVSFDIFKTEIVDRLEYNIRAFRADYEDMAMETGAEEGEEEE